MRDPDEKRNLVVADPLRAAWAREELHHWIASVARGAAAGTVAPARMTREQCENLKSMGYLASDVPCAKE